MEACRQIAYGIADVIPELHIVFVASEGFHSICDCVSQIARHAHILRNLIGSRRKILFQPLGGIGVVCRYLSYTLGEIHFLFRGFHSLMRGNYFRVLVGIFVSGLIPQRLFLCCGKFKMPSRYFQIVIGYLRRCIKSLCSFLVLGGYLTRYLHNLLSRFQFLFSRPCLRRIRAIHLTAVVQLLRRRACVFRRTLQRHAFNRIAILLIRLFERLERIALPELRVNFVHTALYLFELCRVERCTPYPAQSLQPLFHHLQCRGTCVLQVLEHLNIQRCALERVVFKFRRLSVLALLIATFQLRLLLFSILRILLYLTYLCRRSPRQLYALVGIRFGFLQVFQITLVCLGEVFLTLLRYLLDSLIRFFAKLLLHLLGKIAQPLVVYLIVGSYYVKGDFDLDILVVKVGANLLCQLLLQVIPRVAVDTQRHFGG